MGFIIALSENMVLCHYENLCHSVLFGTQEHKNKIGLRSKIVQQKKPVLMCFCLLKLDTACRVPTFLIMHQ